MSQRRTVAAQNVSGQNESMNISVQEQRLRRKRIYRELLEDGTKINERVENNDAKETLAQIENIIEQTNQLCEESKNDKLVTATEKVIDASVLKLGHEIVGAVVKNLGEQEFDAHAYAESVLKIIGRDKDWSRFAQRIYHIPKPSMFNQWLLGTFKHDVHHEPKAKKERVARQKAKVTEMKKPDQVDTLKREEKGAQLVAMIKAQIQELYDERGPLPYMDLIIDPSDYMASVDNAFQVSFLIRDGTLGVTLNKDQEIFVFVTTNEQVEAKKKSVKTIQAVMTLSVAKWKEKSQELAGKPPMINIDRAEFWQEETDLTAQTQKPSRLAPKPSVKTHFSQMAL